MTELTATPPCVTLQFEGASALITMGQPQAMNAFNAEQRKLFRAA